MAKRSRGTFIGILLVAMVAATVLTAGGAAPAAAGTGPAPGRVHKDAGYGGIPLFFIPNEGQLDERVAYAITGRDKSVYFTPDGLTFVLTERTKPAGGRRLLREIQ